MKHFYVVTNQNIELHLWDLQFYRVHTVEPHTPPPPKKGVKLIPRLINLANTQ